MLPTGLEKREEIREGRRHGIEKGEMSGWAGENRTFSKGGVTDQLRRYFQLCA